MAKKLENQKKPKDSFESVAQRLGCDESEAVFDEKLRRIGTAKPPIGGKKPKPANK